MSGRGSTLSCAHSTVSSPGATAVTEPVSRLPAPSSGYREIALTVVRNVTVLSTRSMYTGGCPPPMRPDGLPSKPGSGPSVHQSVVPGYRTSFCIAAGFDPVTVPSGISVFPKEIFRTSRRWAERRFTDLRFFSEPDKGGHFAAFEQPERFVEDVRAFFRTVR